MQTKTWVPADLAAKVLPDGTLAYPELIPAVTVEKLLDIVRNLPFAHKCEVHGRIFYMLTPKPEYPMTALSRWLDLTDDERKDALAAAIGRADE